MSPTKLPTKKQRELLSYIERFIIEHGYSPSYREIMTGLDYNSVATVALHVNNLISRGLLRKRDRSARSLEVVESTETPKVTSNQVSPSEERWLIDKVEHFFRQAEQTVGLEPAKIDELYVLVGALRVLSLNGAAESFTSRLAKIKQPS